jgi:hypothetical protein
MQPKGTCITPFYLHMHALAVRVHRTPQEKQDDPPLFAACALPDMWGSGTQNLYCPRALKLGF